MRGAVTAIACSCVLISAISGVGAFVAPASTFQKLDSSSGGRACSSSRGGVERRLGARPDLAKINVGATGAKRGRGCQQQQQQQHVLKAQMTDEEMALDQALIQRVAQEVESESGVELEQLINPGKVINLERDLVKLRAALENDRGSERDALEQSVAATSHAELMTHSFGLVNHALGAHRPSGRQKTPDSLLRELTEIAKKESTLAIEKRTYMKGWLKKIFVGQAVITTILGGLMAYDAVPFFPDVDLSIRVLGFWFVWLFTVPSLRARKPGEAEKVALNIAFLATPVVSFAAPFVTKDTVSIYWANIAVLTACYAYGFTIGKPDGDNAADQNQPQWLKFIYKSLDFGSGKERGARRGADDDDE